MGILLLGRAAQTWLYTTYAIAANIPNVSTTFQTWPIQIEDTLLTSLTLAGRLYQVSPTEFKSGQCNTLTSCNTLLHFFNPSFFSILIQSFGYTSTEALLYNTPSGAVTFVFIIGCLYLGDRYKHRIAFAIASLFVAATGVLLIWFLPLHNKTGRLIAYYL